MGHHYQLKTKNKPKISQPEQQNRQQLDQHFDTIAVTSLFYANQKPTSQGVEQLSYLCNATHLTESAP